MDNEQEHSARSNSGSVVVDWRDKLAPLPAAMTMEERIEQARSEAYEAAIETMRGQAEKKLRQHLLSRIKEEMTVQVQHEERRKLLDAMSDDEKRALMQVEIDRKVNSLSVKLKGRHSKEVEEAVNKRLDDLRDEMRQETASEISTQVEERVKKERAVLRDEAARLRTQAEKIKHDTHSQKADIVVRKRVAELEARASREQAQNQRHLNKLKSAHAALETEAQELRVSSQKTEEKYAKEVQRTAKLSRELEDKKRDLAAAEEKIQGLETRASGLAAQLEEMRTELGEMREEHAHAMVGIQEAVRRRQEAEDNLIATREQLIAAQGAMAGLECDLEDARQHTLDLQMARGRPAPPPVSRVANDGSSRRSPSVQSLDDVLDGLSDLGTPVTAESVQPSNREAYPGSPLRKHTEVEESSSSEQTRPVPQLPARRFDAFTVPSDPPRSTDRPPRGEQTPDLPVPRFKGPATPRSGQEPRAPHSGQSRAYPRSPTPAPRDGETVDSVATVVHSHFETEARAQHMYLSSAPLKIPGGAEGNRILYDLERLFVLWDEVEASFSRRCQVIERIRTLTTGDEPPIGPIGRIIKHELTACKSVLERHREELELVKRREEIKSKLLALKRHQGSKSDLNAAMAELRRTDQKMRIGVEAARKLSVSPVRYRGLPYVEVLKVDGVVSV
ncbi:chromosome segregation protein [Carpediemonas membranifera]|uniref:Chromosome segregation protein n=1 Tax=Carpediemonas membranifera TaxID=201153 RepID=A0A8J6EB19_9EUKA|nr:chromosome segregation protein [Carpediemonas membranifera]|eukprot:KAG9395995.1 chromosome segregation protein [Carpediemonas membranifera]